MRYTPEQQEILALRMNDMADELLDRTTKQIQAEGILQWPDIATVLAIACVKSVALGHKADRVMGSGMAQTALRVIIKTLMINHIAIPNLEMDGWVPPNIQWGNDSKH